MSTQGYYYSTGTSDTTTWSTWTGTSTASATTTYADVTWNEWQPATEQPQPVQMPQRSYQQAYQGVYAPPPMSAQDIERALEAGCQEVLARKAAKKKAEKKAEKLLLESLNKEQKKHWKERQEFVVLSQSGRKFRIVAGRTKNVHEIDEHGNRLTDFCIVANDVPVPDQLLAQKLLLEHAEAEFLRLANSWPAPVTAAALQVGA
jgi:hypothetical protein